jgi:hypothetical protein
MAALIKPLLNRAVVARKRLPGYPYISRLQPGKTIPGPMKVAQGF